MGQWEKKHLPSGFLCVAAAVLTVGGLAWVPSVATAGPVEPGETIRQEELRFDDEGPDTVLQFLPGGTLLAEKRVSFITGPVTSLGQESESRFLPFPRPTRLLTRGQDERYPDDRWGGTLTTQVYRNPRGTLSFVYRPVIEWGIFFPFRFADEAGEINVSGFAGFSTFVQSHLTDGSGFDVTVSRSSDGDTILTRQTSYSVGAALNDPLLVVHTNARHFDSGGTLEFYGGEEYLFYDILEEAEYIEGTGATAFVDGVFAPAFSDVDGPAVIPLPAGVWGGLVGLSVAAGAWRRARGRSRGLAGF